MTLPASGQISFNDLRGELGISSQAPFSITTAATNGYVTINTSSPSYPNNSTPHAISEWYSYNHNAVTCTEGCLPGTYSCFGDTAVCTYQFTDCSTSANWVVDECVSGCCSGGYCIC